MQVADEVLLDAPDVRITTIKAVIEGTTYPISGITSVQADQEPPGFLLPLALSTAGLVLLACGGSLAVFAGLAESGVGVLIGAAGIVGGGLLLAGAGLVVAMGRPTYLVILGTAGGDRQALSTRDPAFASEVRAAIEDAITRRG